MKLFCKHCNKITTHSIGNHLDCHECEVITTAAELPELYLDMVIKMHEAEQTVKNLKATRNFLAMLVEVTPEAKQARDRNLLPDAPKRPDR